MIIGQNEILLGIALVMVIVVVAIIIRNRSKKA